MQIQTVSAVSLSSAAHLPCPICSSFWTKFKRCYWIVQKILLTALQKKKNFHSHMQRVKFLAGLKLFSKIWFGIEGLLMIVSKQRNMSGICHMIITRIQLWWGPKIQPLHSWALPWTTSAKKQVFSLPNL